MDIHVDETAERNLIGDYENCWVQVGNDVNAAGSYKSFGASIDISSIVSHDSTESVTLATGAYGHVMVFNYTFGDGDVYDGEWTQLGESVPGKQKYDQFGHSISISSDGRVVAVGAPFYNNDTLNQNNVGYVRVYGYGLGSGSVSASWSQIGQDIDGYTGNQNFGYSVSLSDDGLTIIIGTNHFVPGSTRIFRYNELNDEQWHYLGEPIAGTDKYDGKESATSISGDGTTIAIGAPFDRKTRIFQYLGNWTQIGDDIRSDYPKDKAGGTVSLSSDGTVIAIGAQFHAGINGLASGCVRVYSFNNATNKWDQLGADIDGEDATDYSGSWVSLSDDALTVAIGAWSNDDNGDNAGHVRVYRYESDTWKQYGHDIDGSGSLDFSGARLSLSPDGQLVAIGARGYNSGAGQVRIFANTNKNCTITSQPSSQPTFTPSSPPSSQPTDTPAYARFPSAVPSHQPSRSPSKSPTEPVDRGIKATVPNQAFKRSVLACVLSFVVAVSMMDM